MTKLTDAHTLGARLSEAHLKALQDIHSSCKSDGDDSREAMVNYMLAIEVAVGDHPDCDPRAYIREFFFNVKKTLRH